MVNMARIEELIQAGSLCRVTHHFLGDPNTVMEEFGIFTGVLGGTTLKLTATFINGNESPGLIHDVSWIQQIEVIPGYPAA